MLQAHFLNGGAPGGTGIVDQHVDAAELGSSLLHNIANLVQILDVAGKCQRFDAELF